MKPAPTSPLLPLAAVLLVSGPLQAQDRSVQSDMDYARGLAQRFGYVDYSEEVLDDLRSKGLSGEDAEGLELLACDVYAVGARNQKTPEERIALYDKALAAYQVFMDKNAYSDLLPAAQKSFVSNVNDFGQVLERVMEDQLGAEREATREKIRDVIDSGLELTGDLIDETEGAQTAVEKNERYRLMLNRGQMLLTMATVSEDGSYYFGRANSTLEELAGEAGETSGAGLNAYVLMSKVYLAEGDYQSAADFAQFVFDVVLPDEETRAQLGWDDLSYEEKLPRWRIGELTLDSLVRGLLGVDGGIADACAYSLRYYNDWRVEGFDISPLGYVSLLSAARALLESGGYVGGQLNGGNLRWFSSVEEMSAAGFNGARNSRSALDLALSIAQSVNEENRGNSLQVRAQRVISDVIGRPGIVVSPDILFEAAQGELFGGDYPSAAASFKGILHRLDTRDQATRQQYTPKVLFHLGRAYSRMGRELEAALTFREAAKNWAGDPEYDQQIADGYYNSIRRAKGSSPDQLLQNLVLEAEDNLRQLDAGGGAIAYRQAERAYGQGDYSKARDLYQQVEEGAEDYEKALARAALCLYKLGDEEGAVREFKAYLEGYVQDPRTKPVDAKKIRTRDEAMAIATFYIGRIAFGKNDWDGVIETLNDFAREFPEQTDYSPTALYMVVKAFLARGEVAEARRVVAEMREAFGDHARTGSSAYALYEALRAEAEKVAEAGDAALGLELKREMADLLALYNALASKPTYGILRAESVLWLDLGEWATAEEVLRGIVRTFGEGEKADVEAHVLPDLGLALLEQEKIPDAYAVLDPLIPKTEEDTRKPSSATVSRWCRSVAGWVTGDSTNVVEVPGVGGAADLEVACTFLRQLTESEGYNNGKYTCPWYLLKFETAYAYYQWGKEDSAKLKDSFALIENLQNMLSSARLDGIADECGDDRLQRRFLWLLDLVR